MTGDEVDIAAERRDAETAARVAAALARAGTFVKGAPGACEDCETQSPRLVGGRCARCRDGRAQP